MEVPIQLPKPVRFGKSNIAQQRGPVSDASNTFIAGSFVALSSGALVAVATGAVACYGYSWDASHASTDTPPVAFFGENHYVVHPEDTVFEINAAAFSTDTATVGSSGVTYADLTLGQKYGIGKADNAAFAGYHLLNSSDTTNDFFELIGLAPGMAATDKNPRVLVKLLKAVYNE